MHNTWVVLKREYLERVRTKSFLITTLILPVLMAAVMVLPNMLATMKSRAVRRIVVVAPGNELVAGIQQQLNQRSQQVGTKFAIEGQTDGSPAAIAKLRQRMESKQIDGYLLAGDAQMEAGKAQYAARDTSDFMETAALQSALTMALARQRLAQRGVSGTDADQIFSKVDLDTVTIREGKESKASGPAMLIMSMVMMMMIYITVLLYGVAVMRAVLEEKNSRVVEVILASATPRELMAGKILGVGAVGMTQIAIWWLMAAGLSVAGLASGATGLGGLSVGNLKLGYFLLFFVLGYFLYATLWAALGAMVNSEQEAQQMQFFVMLPLIFSMVVMIAVIRQPNSGLAVWMSFVPFCMPLIMYLRVIVQQPPLWHIALATTISLATIYGLMVACSRIYRVGILMYGKRPTLAEILKWMKYA